MGSPWTPHIHSPAEGHHFLASSLLEEPPGPAKVLLCHVTRLPCSATDEGGPLQESLCWGSGKPECCALQPEAGVQGVGEPGQGEG